MPTMVMSTGLQRTIAYFDRLLAEHGEIPTLT